MRGPRKIGIFGHYGNKNLGDEAIIQSVIQNIRQRLPDAAFVCFSINPEDTSARYGVDSYPIRKTPSAVFGKTAEDRGGAQPGASVPGNAVPPGLVSNIKSRAGNVPLLFFAGKVMRRLGSQLKKLSGETAFLYASYQRLKDIDVLMITGSNQFLDNFGGPWGFPYTLLKWSILAKLSGAKVYYVSVGAGPIARSLSKTFIRWALCFADYVSLRDVSSERLIHEIGCKLKSHVYPDLAHSLRTDHISASALPVGVQKGDLPVVGINPMPLYDPRYWCDTDEGKYSAYLRKMADFTAKLIANGYPVFFFATQEKDNNVIVDILQALAKERQVDMPFDKFVLTSVTVDELMANIAAADITVATRFHGTVLSLLAAKPMLGICYYRKARELLYEMGQQNYAVELDTFTVDDLWSRFENLVNNRVNEQERIKTKNLEYTHSLKLQYDSLFVDQVATAKG